ncbi:MAG: error-prone DNA polymerase [Phycisphaerales bacterium]
MPDAPFHKAVPHPFKDRSRETVRGRSHAPPGTAYAELSITSNYTFLTGASHPEELVRRAAELGHTVTSIADTNTLAGVVRAHVAARDAGIPIAIGTRLRFHEPTTPEIIVYPTDRAAYGRLCRLLTLGKRRAPKGECDLSLHDLIEHSEGMLAIVDPPTRLDDHAIEILQGLREVFTGDRLSLAMSRSYTAEDMARCHQIEALSRIVGVPLVATNGVRYHIPERRPLQDVLTCIRLGCTVDRAGRRLAPNAERYLKPSDEMARLFAQWPGAVARTSEVALRAVRFSLDELRYDYPAEPVPEGMTPTEYLRRLTEAGALRRFPDGVPESVRRSIEHELGMIAELHYEAYFLTCEEIVRFARSRGILCQGRGGAANSAVCYCLGITEVNPAGSQLLFERFISRERGEPPDIDIDFEHERREEVIQHIYAKYGRDRAALTAEVISYRGRSAVRDVGKALGLSQDMVDRLAKHLDHWGESATPERLREAGVDPGDPTIRRLIVLCRQIRGFPRHLSQHVGGFVITRSPLNELVPVENAAMEDRTVIEWDKDDIDAVGMLKIDCLGLGMLTCIRKALQLITGAQRVDEPYVRILREPGDTGVYDMLCRADAIGVFQVESRAQMSMLPRLRPREFYDLVIEVAIVRPGPIQGGMVHPYLRRRSGQDPVTYPNADIESVLGRTLGVPLFQEQAMRLAIVAAGFTPDEADRLRRAMAAWKRKGDAIFRFGQKIIAGMIERGYPREFAERCFEQIKGFSEYGFPESHAASFALIVYASAWLKRYHPAAFAAALINSQPMGFYAPAQIVRDAREHGVEVLPIDTNHSAWDCTLEGNASAMAPADAPPDGWGAGGPAIRLGMRLCSGLPEADAHRVTEAVESRGAFPTIESLWRASGASVRGIRALARGDAFGSMGLDRRAALWQTRSLRQEPMPLFDGIDGTDDTGVDRLPITPPVRMVTQDYDATGLSLRAHPMSFLRNELEGRGITPAGELRDPARCPQGRIVQVAGVVLCRQRPGTASGVVFITLEDETGIANLIVWSDTFERFRSVARPSTTMCATGKIERQGEVVHLHTTRIESLDTMAPALNTIARNFH